MTEDLTGWHPDPTGRHEHRYYDGSAWTDHVADGGVLSTDPVAAPAQVSKPAEPSRVDLPAITPEMLAGGGVATPAEPAPTAVAAPDPAPASVAASPPAAGADTDAIDNQAIAAAMTLPTTRPTMLALLLSIVFPGTGHLYLGQKRELGFGLIAATVVGVILAHFVAPWFIGLIVILGAAIFALRDLMPTLQPVMNSHGGGLGSLREVGAAWGWRLVAGGGIVLIIALLLPWFRIKSSLGGIDASATASGFDALEFIDIISLIVGIAAVAAAVVALGVIRGQRLPDALPLVLAVAGAVCVVLIDFRMLFPGAGDIDGVDILRSPGIFLASASALTIAFGAASALQGERS